MIDIKRQLDMVLNSQLKSIDPLLAQLKEGEQKDFFLRTIKELKETKKLDPIVFIDQFSKIKGEEVDIDKLKEMVKNFNNGA